MLELNDIVSVVDGNNTWRFFVLVEVSAKGITKHPDGEECVYYSIGSASCELCLVWGGKSNDSSDYNDDDDKTSLKNGKQSIVPVPPDIESRISTLSPSEKKSLSTLEQVVMNPAGTPPPLLLPIFTSKRRYSETLSTIDKLFEIACSKKGLRYTAIDTSLAYFSWLLDRSVGEKSTKSTKIVDDLLAWLVYVSGHMRDDSKEGLVVRIGDLNRQLDSSGGGGFVCEFGENMNKDYIDDIDDVDNSSESPEVELAKKRNLSRLTARLVHILETFTPRVTVILTSCFEDEMSMEMNEGFSQLKEEMKFCVSRGIRVYPADEDEDDDEDEDEDENDDEDEESANGDDRNGRKAVSTRTTSWENSIGGLPKAKSFLQSLIKTRLLHPQLYCASSGISMSVTKTKGRISQVSVLLFGPPGTGKTLIAKGIAAEGSLPFRGVKGPELLNEYVGESEKAVRKVFDWGRRQCRRPRKRGQVGGAVIFFDELDSLVPSRSSDGGSESSSGVMGRVVSTFCSELDANNEKNLGSDIGSSMPAFMFILAATNRPDLIDPALMSAQRFNYRLYISIEGQANRIDCLEKAMHGFVFKDRLTAAEMSRKVYEALNKEHGGSGGTKSDEARGDPLAGFTGADLTSIAQNAMMAATLRKIADLDKAIEDNENAAADNLDNDNDNDNDNDHDDDDSDLYQVEISFEDLMEAGRKIKPSVTKAERAKFQRLKELYDNTTDDNKEVEENGKHADTDADAALI